MEMFQAPSGEMLPRPTDGRLEDIRASLSLALESSLTLTVGGEDADNPDDMAALAARHAMRFHHMDENNDFIGVYSGTDEEPVEVLSRAELAYITCHNVPL